MTPEQDDYLRRHFSGDMSDAEPDVDGPPPVLRGPRLGRYVPAPPAPRVLPAFARLMSAVEEAPVDVPREAPPSVSAPSVPARAFLLEGPGNLERWLREASDIASDVRLGIATSSFHATRLMLEAIPVVQQLVTKT